MPGRGIACISSKAGANLSSFFIIEIRQYGPIALRLFASHGLVAATRERIEARGHVSLRLMPVITAITTRSTMARMTVMSVMTVMTVD